MKIMRKGIYAILDQESELENKYIMYKDHYL